MRAKIPEIFSERRAHQLMNSYPQEVVYQWMLALEYIYHVGVRPKGGLDDDVGPTPPLPPNTMSSGLAPPGRGVIGSIDPAASLGVRYWHQELGEGGIQHINPIYGTPKCTGSEFPNAPDVIIGYVEYDEKSDLTEAAEEFGRQIYREAKLTIPYLYFLENNIDPPKIGDLVEFWANSWHTLGVFYDVVKVSEDGRINDSPFFVQWLLELRRRDQYLPERRLLGCGVGDGEC